MLQIIKHKGIYPELDIQEVTDFRLMKEWNMKHPPDKPRDSQE